MAAAMATTTTMGRWRRFRCARRYTVRVIPNEPPFGFHGTHGGAFSMDSRLRRNDGGKGVMQAAALLNLLQFASPALPIGAYSYSQGLEAALEAGEVHNADTARAWIVRHLHEVVAQWEAPVAWRLMQAWSRRDWRAVAEWSEKFIASRDSAEFRAETIQMGYSLTRLVAELGIADAAMLAQLQAEAEVALPTAFACAVAALDIPHDAALLAMLFAWAENQVLVCVKSVPLGQVAGQRMLLSLREDIDTAARHAQAVSDDDMCNWAPGLSLLSMQHEVQYSRLYRS
jgi:urease accessory protein